MLQRFFLQEAAQSLDAGLEEESRCRALHLRSLLRLLSQNRGRRLTGVTHETLKNTNEMSSAGCLMCILPLFHPLRVCRICKNQWQSSQHGIQVGSAGGGTSNVMHLRTMQQTDCCIIKQIKWWTSQPLYFSNQDTPTAKQTHHPNVMVVPSPTTTTTTLTMAVEIAICVSRLQSGVWQNDTDILLFIWVSIVHQLG